VRACAPVRSLSGGELFDQIADEDYKMTEAEVIRYVRQVCEGLQHMHEQNIVHLDVKVSSLSLHLPTARVVSWRACFASLARPTPLCRAGYTLGSATNF